MRQIFPTLSIHADPASRTDAALPLTVVVDSIDTLLSNESGTVSSCYSLLSQILSSVHRHRGTNPPLAMQTAHVCTPLATGHSRLIVHGIGSSSLTSIISQPSFSSTLAHLSAYPSALLINLAASYNMPPAPLTAPERFWSVFSPIAEREHESESLVFGPNGEGYGGDEIVVEIVIRSSGEGRRRGIDRELEGWIVEGDFAGAYELKRLVSLSGIWNRKILAAEVCSCFLRTKAVSG